MANVDGRISLSVYDANGAKSNYLLHVLLPEATSLTDVAAAIATAITAFETVSTGGIKEAIFSLVTKVGARAPQADANTGSGAVFDFANASDPTIFGLWVPSFLDSLLGPGRAIDITTAGAAKDFADGMVGGIYTNARWITNSAKTRAFRTNRKLR